jgi:hypothetical protein
MTSIKTEEVYPPDREVLELLQTHGAKMFRKVDIWAVDWATKARALDLPGDPAQWRDPRTWLDKQIFRWLAWTQPRKQNLLVRLIQRALRILGW